MVLVRVLPDLLPSPRVERLDLRGFDLAEVREQLSAMAVEEANAQGVLDVTGGNVVRPRGRPGHGRGHLASGPAAADRA
jgi:hypothetical protein